MTVKGPGAPVTATFGTRTSYVLAEYGCSAGGVGWPSLLLIYGPGDQLVDWITLAKIDPAEHASVTRWSRDGAGVDVGWVAYEGASFQKRFHTSQLTLRNGRALLTATAPAVTEASSAAKAVNAFLSAAVAGDPTTMRSLATPTAYAAFVAAGAGPWSRPSHCTIQPSYSETSCTIAISSGQAGHETPLTLSVDVSVSIDARATITTIRAGAAG